MALASKEGKSPATLLQQQPFANASKLCNVQCRLCSHSVCNVHVQLHMSNTCIVKLLYIMISFYDSEEVHHVVMETTKLLKTHVPQIKRSLALYLSNDETEHILFRPVKVNHYMYMCEGVVAIVVHRLVFSAHMQHWRTYHTLTTPLKTSRSWLASHSKRSVYTPLTVS